MMLGSPKNFLKHSFIILNTLETKILQYQKIDLVEKNDTFVRYCPSMTLKHLKIIPQQKIMVSENKTEMFLSSFVFLFMF